MSGQTPETQPPETTTAFAHRGRGGAACRIGLVNFLLALPTLGFWRFWGRTRVRRYLWENTTLWGEPLEYTGTGKELLIGFLVILVVVFLPLMSGFIVAATLHIVDNPLGGAVLQLALYLLTYFLVVAGLYRARRYQLSRTVWRGIRGGQGGTAWQFALLSMGVSVVVAVTLGWATPWAEMTLASYRMRHTRFGDVQFACDVDAKGLYKRFALVWLSWIPAIAIYSATVGAVIMSLHDYADISEFATQALRLWAGIVGGGVVAALVVALPLAWYKAAMFRRLAEATSYAGTRFSVEIAAWPLIRLVFGNALISLLSLGILRPWAAVRSFRFFCQVVRVHGQPDFAAIRQSTDHGPRAGEGLVSVLDGGGDF
jgi:uncharacterized membrane protein YjgN (DUF898 family)